MKIIKIDKVGFTGEKKNNKPSLLLIFLAAAVITFSIFSFIICNFPILSAPAF